MAHRLDRPLPHCRVEDFVMLLLQARRIDDVSVFGDVLDDRLSRLIGITKLLERLRDGLVDDL